MRVLTSMLAVSLVAGGCASTSYRISNDELQRLIAIDPAHRGERVRVDQELHDLEVAEAEPVDARTEVTSRPSVHIEGRHDWRPPRGGGGGGGHSGGGGGGGGGGGAGDAKGAAIAIVIVAAVAMFVVAAIESARFDGDVELHPMHPVHLFGRDGGYEVVPLAWVDQELATWADHAVVRSTEGPWRPGARAPLWRTGWTYGMYGGASTLRSIAGDTALGTAFAVQLGYFPREDLGVLGTLAFAWRDNRFHETLFDARTTAELQYLPLRLGRLHAGIYGGAGTAVRAEDGVAGGDRLAGGDRTRAVPSDPSTTVTSSLALTGGAMFQLALHTRIALTARFGIAATSDERMRDAMFGLSVY
jgi:hypothetical protein